MTDSTTDRPHIIHREGGEKEVTFADMEREILGSQPEASLDNAEQKPGDSHQERPARVPAEAIEGERKRRQEAEARAKELERMVDVGNQRLQELISNLSAPAQGREAPTQAHEPIPDAATDPVGHFKAITAAQQKQLAELQARVAGTEDQRQQQTLHQRFVSKYAADAQTFSQQKPDFGQAYNHVIQGLVGELVEAGYGQQEAIARVNGLEQEMAAKAWEKGGNPAESIYKLAMKRGYKPSSAPQQQAEDFAVIERGVRDASTSLSQGTGATNSTKGLTLKQLAQMSPSEWAKLPYDLRQRALRGG